mgnify:CR=1 FL=1
MKKEYTFDVNGFHMTVSYEEETIEKVFLPLLREWSEMKKEKGKRIFVFLSAPPGVGKTTVAQFMEYLSQTQPELEEIQAIGLDGFHYHQNYILSHTAMVDGREVPMKDVKGCPETFDIDKLKQKLSQLTKGDVKWPIYDRNLHDVVEDAVLVNKEIILIEGNWLLSTEGDWNSLIEYCDDSIFIYAEEDKLKDRLIQRKMHGGLSFAEAEKFYENSDRKNVNRLIKNHHSGRINLLMQENGNYELDN